MFDIYVASQKGVDWINKVPFGNFSLNNIKREKTYIYATIKPRKRQSKLSIRARDKIEAMGYTLLHEVPCRENKSLSYDYALLYTGWFGTQYLYYIEIDGQQHFSDNHFLKYDRSNDIVKTKFAIRNSYIIRVDFENVYNVTKVLHYAFDKIFDISGITTSDDEKYQYLLRHF